MMYDEESARDEMLEDIHRRADQAPIVTVPKAAAPDRGSVGEQIREQWAILHGLMDSSVCDDAAIRKTIRKLDALIGYDDAK